MYVQSKVSSASASELFILPDGSPYTGKVSNFLCEALQP
jgi:hypothetical protein